MRIDVAGASLHVEVRGSGPTVLFVHGFPLTGELWSPVAERLAGERRSLIPDLRGHGRSGVGEVTGLRSHADDLVAVLDATGVAGPVPVVGLSMGGYVALELCRAHPERVGALVLVDTRAGGDSQEAAQARRDTARRVLEQGSTVLADSMVERLFAPSASPELRRRWHELMAATPPEGAAAALLAMADRPDSFATLRDFRRPVLLVVGAEDAITPPDEARLMQEAAPHARLEVIPEAGHMTPVEQPDRFAEVLLDFLREVR